MQTQLPFENPEIRIHTHETSELGTTYIQDEANREDARNNCNKLIRYWQRNNFWINKHDALRFCDVDCLQQRIPNIEASGIPIERSHRHMGGKLTSYRLKCTCHLIGGVKDRSGCYVHSEELKLK